MENGATCTVDGARWRGTGRAGFVEGRLSITFGFASPFQRDGFSVLLRARGRAGCRVLCSRVVEPATLVDISLLPYYIHKPE